MSNHYLMALDAGSGGGRCLLVEVESGKTSVAARTWKHQPFSERGAWGFDLDTARCWDLLCEAARQVKQKVGVSPEAVLGVSATSMRHGDVLLDGEGHELFAVPNRDARAASEASELAIEYGTEIYSRSGHWPIPISRAARLRWLSRNAPDILQRTACVLSISDWIAFRLSGRMITEPSQAGESCLYNIKTRKWDWEMIDDLGLPRFIFPPVTECGVKIGNLTEAAAKSLRLQAGIPVIAGGADTQCGLVGAGAIGAGEVGIIAGSTAPIQLVLDQPLLDPGQRLWTGLHIVPGHWVLESNAGAMGESLEWLASVLYCDAPRPVARLMAEAGKSTPGAGGFLSTFGAEIMDTSNVGFTVGNLHLTQFIGVDSATRRAHLSRAMLEGLAYACRANITQISGVAGQPVEYRLAGGLSRSPLWSQIVSDVLNSSVLVTTPPEASLLGAAICAGAGAGVFRDVGEGARKLVRVVRLHQPDEEMGQIYREVYADWTRLRTARAVSDQLAADLMLPSLISDHATQETGQPSPSRPRFLITAQLDEVGLMELGKLGDVHSAGYRQTLRLLTGDELVEALKGFQVFITEVDLVDMEVLQRSPDLKVVVSCRGNAVNVDLDACTALGIPVLNAPGRNADAVAELALAFMLMLGRKLPQANAFLRQPGEAGDMGRMGHAHDELVGREIWDKTVGLVGLGAVGRGVARRLMPFGARVLACDPNITPEEAELVGAELVEMERLLAESDFISLHAAVTDKTRGMFGQREFASMKPGAFFINTARAALVDEEALLEALRSGQLGGAALDVFAVEPPASDHPLLGMPNVIATPHVGGNTLEVAAHQGQIIVSDMQRMLSGRQPLNLLNPQVMAGFSWEGARKALTPEELESLGSRPAPTVSDVIQPAAPLTPAGLDMPFAHTGKGDTPPITVGQVANLSNEPGPEKQTAQEARHPEQASGPQMEKVLRLFIARSLVDPALIAFAARRNVTWHFTMSDLGLEFYLRFKEGQVSGDLCPPEQQAEVRMKASAETIDGILTGRINGNRAAMSGKLSFSGDVRVAMGLQKIQADLVRLYSAAREEAGGPGDLSASQADGRVEKESRPPAARALPTPKTSAIGPDPREEVVQVVDELYQAQLITATGGNVSVRIPDVDQAWITPSQLFKGNLQPDMLVRVDLNGDAIDPEALAPSSERQVHTEIYKARSDVQAVIHAHAPYATVLGLTGKPFLPISTDAAFIKELPRVPFIMPGTKELAQAVVKAMVNNPAVLMQNHGLVVAASSLRRAADLLEVIERTSQLIVECYAVGKKPPTLPKEVVKMLQEVGEMMA